MAYITTAARRNYCDEKEKRISLLNMLQGVFSDSDTNGDNGEEYNHFGNISDDEYMFNKYIKSSLTENEIIDEYAKWYMNTMTSLVSRWQDYSCDRDENGEVIAISYAYY